MATKSTPVRADARTPVRTRGTVQAVRHALQLLRCLSGEGPLGVSELAGRVGLHKSSVSRLVATLFDDDLVERDRGSRRLRVGPGMLSLSFPLLDRIRMPDTTRAQLAELARESGETITLGIWDGAGAVNVEQALGARAIKHYAPPGSRNPAHCTASGKLLLAYASPASIERVIARGLVRYTPKTVVVPDALRAELADIRRQRYAANLGEFAQDVGALAVPVFDASGEVGAALTATVPMYRFAPDRRTLLREMLHASARAIEESRRRTGADGQYSGRIRVEEGE